MKNENEALFMEAVEQACEWDYVLLEQEIQGYHYTFSTGFEDQMNLLFPNIERRKKKRIRFWRHVLIAAVIIVLNVSIVAANEELREKLGNMIVFLYENCIELKNNLFQKDDAERFEKYSMNYISEGFNQVNEIFNESSGYWIEYRNEEGQVILYGQSLLSTDVWITYEGEQKKDININEAEAWIISDGEINTVIFEKEGYKFTISSQEEVEEVIKMAENVTVWQTKNKNFQ